MSQTIHYAKSMMTALALSAAFVAVAEPTFTVDPADGAELKSLETITVTYDVDVDQLEILDESLIEIYGESGMITDYSVVKQLRRAAITIQFSSPITTPGTYQFFVNSGAFSVAGEESGEIEYAYTIVSEPEIPDTPAPGTEEIDPMTAISITPAPGVVNSLNSWNINFNCEWVLDRTSNAKYTLTCSNPDVVLPVLKSRSTNIYFEDNATVTAPGTYTLTVGEGKFLLGEEGSEIPTPEYQFVYVIEENGEAPTPYDGSDEITPAQGAVSRIDNIVIAFEGDVEVINQSNIILSDYEDAIAANVEAVGNTLVITPEKAITRYGQYVLTVDAGSITIGGHWNPAYQYIYIVAKQNGPWSGLFTADPSDDSTVESLKDIAITFEGINRLTLNSLAKPEDFPALYNGVTGDKLMPSINTTSQNILKVSLYSAVTAPGEYVLVVPRAFIYLDGEMMPEDLKVVYYIERSQDYREVAFTFDPSDGETISTMDAIEVTFAAEGLTDVTHNSFAWGIQAPRFVSGAGASVPSIQIKKLTDLSYTFNHTYPFSTPGEYSLVIPAEYFTFTFSDGYEQKNEEITTTFNVLGTSAIDAVENVETLSGEVYNALGICILHNATPDQVKALPAGLYLVNGKKIIVK